REFLWRREPVRVRIDIESPEPRWVRSISPRLECDRRGEFLWRRGEVCVRIGTDAPEPHWVWLATQRHEFDRRREFLWRRDPTAGRIVKEAADTHWVWSATRRRECERGPSSFVAAVCSPLESSQTPQSPIGIDWPLGAAIAIHHR